MGEWPPGKGRQPPGRLAAPPKQARLGYPRYQAVHKEEGAELQGLIPFEADHRLVQVYGDHVYHNNGFRMDRGITDDKVWQVWWQILIIQSGSR